MRNINQSSHSAMLTHSLDSEERFDGAIATLENLGCICENQQLLNGCNLDARRYEHAALSVRMSTVKPLKHLIAMYTREDLRIRGLKKPIFTVTKSER